MVIRTESGFHRVLVGDDVIVCRAPKRLLRGERTATTAVVIGDRVRITPSEDGAGMIDEVLERKNELVRGGAGESRYLDVIAANLDLLVVVHSLRDPDLNLARLDRFLLIAEAAEIPALVCLNKVDLTGEEFARDSAATYERSGYPVIITSATTEEHVDDLRAALMGKLSALIGPSGVGKSSLLNDIQPGLRLRTGEISESTGKGRHTTTTAELLRLTDGGWVADTPGLRELAIREVEPQELEWLFPEFRQHIPACRFRDCTHREEIECGVKAALARGEIAPDRYASYRSVYEDLVEQLPF
ncbi:MAG: ribosome small subunit-dependent GTPase A [Chloroflexota bacterium]